MSTLQICWIAVAACTVIFLIVAAISALPKMKAPYTAVTAAIFLAASGITAFGSIAPYLSAAGLTPPGLAATYKLPPAPVPGVPLNNDARRGKVVFTFDDGPDGNTGQVIAEMNALHIRGVFFVIGAKAAAHPEIIRAEVANGEVVGNHTWDHRSLTGKGTGTRPLSQAQVRDELSRADAAVVMAGAPKPSLWRPPYGGVNRADEKTAAALGLRVVLDSGKNIIDANDWQGLSAAQIAARVNPVLRNATIITFHDGLPNGSQTAQALPLIVAYMNAHHLGATTDIRPDATGGVVPYLGPVRPVTRGQPALTAPRSAAQPAAGTAAPAAGTAPSGGSPPLPAGSPAPAPSTTSPAPAPSPSTTSPKPAPSPTTPAPAPSTTSPPPAPAPSPSTTNPAPNPSPSVAGGSP